MKKEKVFICITQIRSLKTKHPDSWQVTEKVEFVDQVRKRHVQTCSAIGDYINRKVIVGASRGVTDYDKFEEYVRGKYPKQMTQLDEFFRPAPLAEAVPESPAVTVDGENVVVQ